MTKIHKPNAPKTDTIADIKMKSLNIKIEENDEVKDYFCHSMLKG